MGGTSTDVSTVVGGDESFTTSFEIEFGLPIQIPMIDIRTMGAGGGSLAWIDKGGMLRVGPESAGARPGPACYGQGGTQATATDANLVLGRINPQNFLGGAMALDRGAAAAAIAEVAGAIDKPVEETALAMVQIANNNMIGALRSVLTERGLDPRDFTLLAFGGAGPVHVADLMVHATIPSGIVPNHPGQFSAFGFLMTDARVDLERTAQMTSAAFDEDHANRVLSDLIGEGIAALEEQGYSETIEIHRSLEMRYLGQNHELDVPLAFDRFDGARFPACGRPSTGPTGTVQFRHSGREDRDDLGQGHGGLGDGQAEPRRDRRGGGRTGAGGHAAGPLRRRLGGDAGPRPRTPPPRASLPGACADRGARLGHRRPPRPAGAHRPLRQYPDRRDRAPGLTPAGACAGA